MSLISTVLALSACGSPSSDGAEITSAPVEPATAKPTASAAANELQQSARGNLIKTVGEPGGIRLEEGSDEWVLNFTVTGIEVDPACTSASAEPAINGHLVAISIEATTGPNPKFSETLYSGVSFASHSWKAIASNGTTVNTIESTATYGCFDQGQLIPNQIGAAEKAAGKVILDVPNTTGTLVYSVDGGSSGWEWEYGTK